MRVVLLTNSIDPAAGGWARYTREIARSLARAQHSVTIFVEGAVSPGTTFDGMQVHGGLRAGAHIGIKNFVKSLLDVRLIRRTCASADVVHACVEHHMFAAALSGRPYGVTAHGTYLPRYVSSGVLSRTAGLWALRGAVKVFFVSDFTRKKLVELVPDLHNTCFVPNGVDIAAFRPVTLPDPARPYVMTVGAVKPRKGQDLVVRALGAVHATFPNLEYVIVGDTLSGKEFVAKLEHLIQEIGVEAQVRFVSNISDDEVVRLYSASLACLLTSRTDAGGSFEGFPLSLLEAAACGTPVVGTYGVGAEHLIEDGVNGFLVAEEDVDRIADILSTLAGDMELRTRMGAAARTAAEKFSWDAHVATLVREYQS